MPNTSGSPTQIATSVATKAELSGVIASAFKSGDQGFVDEELSTSRGPLYVLVLASEPPVDGLDVLSVFGNATARWVSLSLVSGTGFPVSDAVFGVYAAADPTKLLHVNAAGQAAGTTTTIFLGASVSRPFRLPNLSGTAVVQQDVTGFTFLGQVATDNGSNARLQLSSLIANGAQFRSNQYGPNTGTPGISSFKSRGTVIGAPLLPVVPGSGCVGGDVLFGITAVGLTPDSTNIPLAALFRFLVPASFVAVGQNYLPTDCDIQLVPLAGPINGRRIVFKITSEGVTQTLRGVRAGGPGTLPASLSTGSLWSSGTGDPNGVIVGSPGDLFSRTDGGAGTSFYVKESGVGTNTGWVGK